MANVTFKGDEVLIAGELPSEGSQAPDFKLVAGDLSEVALDDFQGKKKILNIFPSLDTGVCAKSVRAFNEKASEMENTVVLGISLDLPFAQNRFCEAEGIENVKTLSAFRSSFPQDYGVTIASGPLTGLCSRAVLVLDENNEIIHSELVSEITEEPDYEKALQAAS